MNKKNLLKLSLDFCMVIVLVLMYNKMSISMTFHELGGLILIGVMLIHVLINRKWVAVVTKKLFNKSIPVKTKLGYVINVLLLISFLLIGISGIFISKTLFHITTSDVINWKVIHYTSSSVALILIGIHLGLHKQFICSICGKLLHLPQKIGRIIGSVLTIFIVIFGFYSMFTTSFVTWVSMPFTTVEMSEHSTREFSSETLKEGESLKGAKPEGYIQGKERPKGGFSEGGGQVLGWGTILTTVTQFFSIAYVFATITALVEMIINSNKKKRKIMV